MSNGLASPAKSFKARVARLTDTSKLLDLMKLSIDLNQRDFLSPQQIELSHRFMGLDTQLIEDKTYFLVETEEGQLAGCGGWSWRATLYGGNHSTELRNDAALNPATDAARIRAMYTHPDFQRRGVGRLILTLCEDSARKAGFRRVEMMATHAGRPLYENMGYQDLETVVVVREGDVEVTCIRMGKSLST